MHPDTLKYFYDQWAEFNTCFAYRGLFQESFTNTILEISSQNPGHKSSNLHKKVSFLLVECFQNVLKHADVLESTQNDNAVDGMFSFKFTEELFAINSINVLKKEEVNNLKQLIEQVNSLDETELKKFYLEHLETNTLSDKGGAGLGLIELARKSGHKILYEIFDLNQCYAQFHQQITLAQNGGQLHEYLHSSADYYELICKENIFLQYKGVFTSKAILPIVEMTEQRYREDNESKSRTSRAMHVLIELLQNISKVNDSQFIPALHPMVLLGKCSQHLYVYAGNVVSYQQKESLEQRMDYLLSLEQEELAELHRYTMKASLRFENKDRTGLGLIEVVRSSHDNVQYQIYPLSSDKYLFALGIKF
ncbi:MAG: SiaB family protein kinase [Flavobacteriales bacterium]